MPPHPPSHASTHDGGPFPALGPLLAPLAALHGVGPATADKLARAAGGTRVLDLLFHLPDGYVDRRHRPTVRDAAIGQVATLAVEVMRHDAPSQPRRPWKVLASDGTGTLELVFFRPDRLRTLPVGSRVLVSGKVEGGYGRLSMPHPDHVVAEADAGRIPSVEPVWGLTAGLHAWQMRSALKQALALLPELPEWHEPTLVSRHGWPGFAEALRALHAPTELPGDAARERVAYDELLAHQVALAWTRARQRHRPGRSVTGDGALRAQALARFGHQPTPSQVRALAEIDADLAAPRRMMRLLQGDVGSGKTLVAALAMLRAAEAGLQAAIMAPTETLARQHHRTLSHLSPLPVGLLTGSVKGVARRNLLIGLENGRQQLVVGTHALFQDTVNFHDLALAVIDEQHRFGVDQRLQLGAKGLRTDVLVMTATPIPRTLLLTQWGEMTVSRLDGKPAGRKPVRTTLHSLSGLAAVVESVARKLEAGERIYWVCPLVTESEVSDLAAAEARFAVLRERFGTTVDLAHGQMETEVREAALAGFAAGHTQLLVATTVIEVGVDVPEASVMVVEHADRFGLAQLHQLRGRVGRGEAQSHCLLLHEDGLTESGRRRLSLLRETEDGFRIADEDFRQRGGGDLLGKKQSGAPSFRLADPVEHEGLLRMAAQDAALLLHRDPGRTGPRADAIRILLTLFEKSAAFRTLASG